MDLDLLLETTPSFTKLIAVDVVCKITQLTAYPSAKGSPASTVVFDLWLSDSF